MCWDSSKPPKPSEPETDPEPSEPTTEPEDTPEVDCTTLQFGPEEVVERITETISNAPPQYAVWNGTFPWDARFSLYVDRASCAVMVTARIKVTGTITAQQLLDWENAIETKWNNKYAMIYADGACPDACLSGYAIVIDLEYVQSGEHYEVTAQQPGATSGGIAGLNGTTSMVGWGVTDLVDITHEFGHMLGATEEYFTTNGVDYTYGGTVQGFRDPYGGIMNNPANDPLPRNYYLIEQWAQTLMTS